jgi:hypothetical protein
LNYSFSLQIGAIHTSRHIPQAAYSGKNLKETCLVFLQAFLKARQMPLAYTLRNALGLRRHIVLSSIEPKPLDVKSTPPKSVLYG